MTFSGTCRAPPDAAVRASGMRLTPQGRISVANTDIRLHFSSVFLAWDQPCDGLQSGEGMVLTIHGTPNLSISEPKPGDQKVSPNGMTASPPSES
jgi:hypothetical protein